MNELEQGLITIATEHFRFSHVFQQAMEELPIEQQSKYSSRFSWFSKRVLSALETAGFGLVDLTGQDYDPGMAVTPLNLDDFQPEDQLVIAQMLGLLLQMKIGRAHV